MRTKQDENIIEGLEPPNINLMQASNYEFIFYFKSEPQKLPDIPSIEIIGFLLE
jgi:hypothetical protein